jgi:hypothetical protein
MFNFPRHLIFSDKVYILSVIHQSGVGRAIHRDLTDYVVEIRNAENESDSHRLFLGVANALALGYRERVPIEWILCRFLCDHIWFNSCHLLDGINDDFLNFKNYKKYLGEVISDEEINKTLSYIFASWIRIFPKGNLLWRDIYVSAISIPEESLKKCLDIFQSKAFSELKRGIP